MDRSMAWNLQQQQSSSGISSVQSKRMSLRQAALSIADGLTDAKLRYDSARSFDSDEDIEWNPCLTSDELNTAYAESSLSARSGRSDAGSPPQQPMIPHSMNNFNQQHPQHSNQGSNSGRYNSRKNRGNNAVPIVNPNHFNVQQWR